MSYNIFVIVALAALSASACASVPQNQAKKEASIQVASCEVKPEGQVASCGATSSESKAKKVFDQSALSRISNDDPFLSKGRLGD